MKGFEKVKELIEGELEDYSYFEIGELKWNDEHGQPEEYGASEEYYIIDITANDKVKTLRFNYDREKDKIGIMPHPEADYYDEVADYNWTIKRFWMALLEW